MYELYLYSAMYNSAFRALSWSTDVVVREAIDAVSIFPRISKKSIRLLIPHRTYDKMKSYSYSDSAL